LIVETSMDIGFPVTLAFSRYFFARIESSPARRKKTNLALPPSALPIVAAQRPVAKTRRFFGPRALRIFPYSPLRSGNSARPPVGPVAPHGGGGAQFGRVCFCIRCAAPFKLVKWGMPGDGTGSKMAAAVQPSERALEL